MTSDELRALAYFAVGVTSEGSNAGQDVSYRLSFAGKVRDGVMDPVGNSGYSFCTPQIDVGQHPDVPGGTEDEQDLARYYCRAPPQWCKPGEIVGF